VELDERGPEPAGGGEIGARRRANHDVVRSHAPIMPHSQRKKVDVRPYWAYLPVSQPRNSS
jgi:hypothetical protein